MTRIYVVRHGETFAKTVKPERVCGARCDSALTDEGKKYLVEHVAPYFQHLPIAVVFCSPSIRSRETAHAILSLKGRQVPAKDSENLREIDYGEFDGQSVEEYEQAKSEYVLNYGPLTLETSIGGAESYRAAANRMFITLRDLGEIFEGQSILLPSHSGVMRALFLCDKVNLSEFDSEIDPAFLKKDIPFGCVIMFEYKKDELFLKEIRL